MKYNKNLILSITLLMIGSVCAQDNIINEVAKGGKFIVRDDEQNEAMVIENGNVSFSGTLKLEVLPKGDISNSIVVWDPVDKLLKLQNQNLNTLSDNSYHKNLYTIGYDGLEDDNATTINASVQNSTAVSWNTFNTDYGYIALGPANQYGWAHIYTNMPRYIFNRPIYSYGGSFSAYSTYNLNLETHGTKRLTILASNGNVGIGTIAPSAKLDVAGQVKITGGAPGFGKVLTSDATGLASWQTPAAGGGVSLWTESGGNIYRSDGNVGIGSTNPLFKLDVNGSAVIGNNSSSSFLNVGDNYYSSLANSLNPGVYVFKNGTNAYGLKLQYTGSEYGTMMFGPNSSNKFLSFGKVGTDMEDDNMIEYMRVDLDNGNVGIGTTNPSTKLDVNGTTSAKRYTASGIHTVTNGVWDLSQGNVAQITFSSGVTPITINSDGGIGTFILVIKKTNSCSDCSISFLGADVKYPMGIIPSLSSGANTTDIFSFIAVDNNTFYCLYANNML
jgi:hypothetical protein